MHKIARLVADLAAPVVTAQGCELWDVEYLKEGGVWVLRVFIDHPDGVSTTHCEAVSRALDPLLDEADPIENSYVLEVSSAGLERPLKRPQDFERFMGHPVEVHFFSPQNGAREAFGRLSGYDGETLSLDDDRAYPMSLVSLVRLRIEF